MSYEAFFYDCYYSSFFFSFMKKTKEVICRKGRKKEEKKGFAKKDFECSIFQVQRISLFLYVVCSKRLFFARLTRCRSMGRICMKSTHVNYLISSQVDHSFSAISNKLFHLQFIKFYAHFSGE